MIATTSQIKAEVTRGVHPEEEPVDVEVVITCDGFLSLFRARKILEALYPDKRIANIVVVEV